MGGGMWRTGPRTWRILRPLARSMRSSPTQAEQTLWARLRHDQLGVRFRAQFVVGRFILDFFCPSRGLAGEVDGGAHVARADIDADRDAWLSASGIRVLRVSNADVLGDIDAVIHRIRAALEP